MQALDSEAEARSLPTLRSTTLHILPSQVRVRHELRRLARQQVSSGTVGALMGPRLVTFPVLVADLYRELGEATRPLSGLARTLLADDVIRDFLTPGGRWFAAQGGFRGFTAQLLRLLDELRRALVTPDQYEQQLLESTPLGTDPRQVVELAELYRRYERRLADGALVDRPAMEQRVLRALESRQEFGCLRGIHELRMEDIYDLTFLQFRIVLALTHRLQRARVFFPYNPQRPDAYRFVGEHTILYFELLGEERVAAAIDPCFKFREQRAGSALSFVLDHIFKAAEERAALVSATADDSLAILAAPGPLREVECIGSDIRQLLEAGVPQESICVVFRNLSPYGRIIEDVFTRYRIPFSFRRGSPLLSSPLASVVLTVLDLAAHADDIERDRATALVSSGYVTLPAADAVEFDRRTARADIRGGPLRQWKAALAAIGCGDDPTLAALRALLEPLAAARPLSDFTRTVRRVLELLGVRDNTRRTHEPAVLARDLEALEQMEAVLCDIESAAAMLEMEGPVKLQDFLRLLVRGLENVALPGHLAHRGGVSVLNALDARGLDFDHVYIGGLAEGQWPQGTVPSPLFSDAERACFRDHAGRRMFRSGRMQAWEDPLLFCLALSMARVRAVLSYPTADARGQAWLRSYFVDEVAALVETQPRVVPSEQIVTPLEQVTDPWELALALGEQVVEADLDTVGTHYPLLPGASARPLLPPLSQLRRAAAIERRRDQFFREADGARRQALAFPFVGRLGTDTPRYRWSASDLEQYANCPFAYFMRKVLHLSPPDRPQVEAPITIVASLVHDLLYRFFDRQRQLGRWVLGDVQAARELFDTVAAEVFARWERAVEESPLGKRRQLRGDANFWSLKQREIRAALHRVLQYLADRWEEDRTWTPTHFELSFGKGEGPFPEPYEVDLPGVGRIELVGQIDRVDRCGQSLRVIDYKWSSNPLRAEEIKKPQVVGKTKFQLLLYLRVAADLLLGSSPAQGQQSLEGAIFLLRKSQLEMRSFEEVPLGQALLDPVGRACQGIFDTSPLDCPTTCDYRHVCRFYLPRTPERTANS